MPEYYITWEIELDADSPEDACKRALEMQRDKDSIATEFSVLEITKVTQRLINEAKIANSMLRQIDLWEGEEDEKTQDSC